MIRHSPLFALAALFGLAAAIVSPAAAAPVGTAFTYQGQLKDGGSAPTGTYDLQFKLFDALATPPGVQIGSTIQLDNVAVTNGLFTVSLDFGAQFNGQALWMEVGVHPGAQPVGNPYTILTPRQPLTATPYALYALSGPGAIGTWTTNGSHIYNTNSGSVGIGASSPGRKLQIGSNSVSNSEGMIRLASRSGTNGSNRVWDIGVPETDADSSGIGYSFVIDDTALGTTPELMVKWGTGNVGIGELSPRAKLHVNRASGEATDAFMVTTSVGIPGFTTTRDTTIDHGAINCFGSGGTGAPLRLNLTSSGNVLLAEGGGNVGIGTASPGYKLDVTDRVRIRQGASPTAGLWLYQNTPADDRAFIGMQSDNRVGFYGRTGAGWSFVMDTTTGGVGIGTTTIPAGVKLAVNGKVLCEELEVQLSQDWPDYVFADDYPLMPLHELEQQIKRDGHLPGLPSAEEVKAQGLHVGEMQAALLHKVEELTLHMIALNKQVGDLQRDNRELRARQTR